MTFPDLWTAIRATDPVEAAGVLTGIACVWLAARNSVWNFPVALVSCGLYVFIFGRARLYSDVGLQFVFIGLSLYGWYQWLHGGAQRPELPVSRTGRREWLGLGVLGAVYALGAGFLFQTYTDAALPYWDTTTTAVSIVAQVLLARKKLENWLLWLAVDVAYVGMYWHRELYLTSGLYAVYLGLAAYGYYEWRQLLRRQQEQTINHPQAA
ncbi:nicotinamide riboside transporter PnuC [Hymenobacter weizhouensis]|uniref:nicotinamide riboside transporter PnuC n=1 Tax=Hymenobacter sp. YIM 151500-1 TaxID=2987689 RepID=UPI0022278868|nr:nicotinamide riboside transporter PnuC [Hymenobacter sp. YIM 151500-1]UYZ63005.1 nicotinamide riboside transporter PnuC [Hymenobacter sp. YIM 151500-1]